MTRSITTVVATLAALSIGFTYLFNKLVTSLEDSYHEAWLFRIILNLLGYATIVLPGYILYRYVYTRHDFADAGCIGYVITACFKDNTKSYAEEKEQLAGSVKSSVKQDALLLLFCTAGLQGSYLTWGVLQEKIMTQTYTNIMLEEGKFRDSQFLVFVNRILALVVSGLSLLIINQPRHTVPLYKYGFCSFTNIMSSWCQYEALKYISFPAQVLAKSCKILAVMFMGKLVSAKPKSYEYFEYISALVISLGMLLFMLSSLDTSDKVGKTTTLSGVILLALYLSCDSFTSNWQGVLFESYKVTSLQMMFGTNLFSCLFTAVSLLQQGGFYQSLHFMLQFPSFTLDCILLSISSAAGQLFVFFTIYKFGAIVFTIIMTVRQGLAILLSCIIYAHPISLLGILGILMVLMAVLLQAYCKLRKASLKKKLNQAEV
ncbi:hypothetical protein M8J76_015223 [Diaphorina citri]|nr:hypothetical protein M8J75_012590 [Diaphorina citri]KAI5750384.1 hypothetical protein M8J76_015223 [Diaphorina citri]KAI5755508.1 hypothetical protein M8J77_017573 [Diaphorina citri]